MVWGLKQIIMSRNLVVIGERVDVELRSKILLRDKEEWRWCGVWSIVSWVGEGVFYTNMFVVYMSGCLMESENGQMVDVENEADFHKDGVGGWSSFLWVSEESDSFDFLMV